MPIWVLDAWVLGEPRLKGVLFSCSTLQTRNFLGGASNFFEKNANITNMFIIQDFSIIRADYLGQIVVSFSL